MTVFEEIRKLKREYDEALLVHQTNKGYLMQDGENCGLEQQQEKLSDLTKSLELLDLVSNRFKKAKQLVIAESAVSYEEANRFFSAVVGRPWENCVGIENIQEKDYLVLYLDDVEENRITLAKKAENGLFYLYFQKSDADDLESYLDYNVDSIGLQRLIRLVEKYIESKILRNVESLDDFLNKYFTYEDIIDDNFRPVPSKDIYGDSCENHYLLDLDYYYSIHEQTSRKNAKRRKATINSKIAKEKTFQTRARKKIDANKLPNNYRR